MRKRIPPVLFLVAVAIITVYALVMYLVIIRMPPTADHVSTRWQPGDSAVLYAKGKRIVVVRNKDADERWSKASRSGDTHGFAELLLTGQIVVCDSGTIVKIIEPGTSLHEVRILSGPCSGFAGFVDSDKVRPEEKLEH